MLNILPNCNIRLFKRKINEIDKFNLKSIFCFLLIHILFISFSYANPKYSNIKIYIPKDPIQRLDLLALLQIDHLHEHDGYFNYTVDQKELALLKASGYKYEIINEDAQAYLAEENDKYYQSIQNGNNRVAFEQPNQTVSNIIKTPAAFKVQPTFGGYYKFNQMVSAIDTLITKYPGITQKFSIGKTTENRDMWCVKISDNVATDETGEPEILFMGHHHAREAISGSSMIFLMQYLCENYTTDNRIKNLVDNREIFIIVCSNPDGWEENKKIDSIIGGGQWRKNKSVNGGGIYGVDLNRNWSINWANCTGAIGITNCGSSDSSNNNYWGKKQYSEPETRNLRTFCRAHDFVTVMDQHSVGPYYSLPWGRLFDTSKMTALDKSVYVQMASVMGKYNGMRYASTYNTLGYEVSGGMKDLLLSGDDSLPNGKVYGMTGEGSNGSSLVSFWPLAAEIITLCKGMVYQDIQLLYTIGSYVDLQDIGNMNIQTTTGKFYFSARRIGLKDEPVQITLIPLQNVATVGGIKTIVSLPNFNDIYIDSIPYTLSAGILNGNTVKYVWKVETAGYTYYDTVTNIYKPNVVFTDNMESGSATTKWTISSGWAYSSDMAYAGTRSLAESPAGAKYANGVTLTAQIKNLLDLTGAGAAYLTFNLRYRCENFYDKLRIEASTNGTTWTALPGIHTIKEPGTNDGSTINGINSITGIREFWTKEVFDLSAYLGVSTLRLRFNFSSDNIAGSLYIYNSDDGFNIDNVNVITGSIPSLLPVELTDFIGHNNGDVNNLYWSTASEINTQKFMIQRSVDAINFEEIGEVQATGNSNNLKNYSFIDENPFFGENLYRLKIVDMDGSYKHSKLLSIQVQQASIKKSTGIANIYPNPCNQQLFVDFITTEENETYYYTIFNHFGQILINNAIALSNGKHIIEINVSDVANGEYFLSFYNKKRNIKYEKKFIKQ